VGKTFDHLLRFRPIYQTRVWGGRRLASIFGRTLPDGQPYGESWELVDRESEQSVVGDGPWAGTTLHTLWTEHRDEVFGKNLRQPDAARCPVLVKVLDCLDDLSIQVHPPADQARALGGEAKTEMWFVAHAETGARIYAGLRAGVGRAEFERALRSGTVAETVHTLQPRSGDSLFVPSGRVHALGAGLVVFEIQQNSDTTYRVFDWNRVGLDGRPRALHITESLASIDFGDHEPTLATGVGELASCPYFRVTRARSGDPAPRGKGRLIMAIAPTTWGAETLRPADVVLAPASLEIDGPEGEWLEVEI
jgi:mannose-6-phosphate isomerase